MVRLPHFLRIILPLLFAALLVSGLFAGSGISLAELIATLKGVSPAATCAILACTLLFLALSTLKWRLVMGHMGVNDRAAPSWNFSLYYTSLGAVLSLVITPHAAMLVSRSVGAKLHLKGSAIANAAGSAYEQFFDVIPVATMSLAAIISIVLNASLAGWLAISAALNIAAFLAITLVFKTPFWLLTRFVPLPQRRRAVLAEKMEWFATPNAKTLLGVPFVATLFAISLVRYAILLLRTGLVMASIDMPISAFQYVKAYGIARLSSIVSITPGELGVTEWTWSGVLTWMGFGLDEAARFALANLIYNYASLLVVFGFAWLAFSLLLAFRPTDSAPAVIHGQKQL